MLRERDGNRFQVCRNAWMGSPFQGRNHWERNKVNLGEGVRTLNSREARTLSCPPLCPHPIPLLSTVKFLEGRSRACLVFSSLLAWYVPYDGHAINRYLMNE